MVQNEYTVGEDTLLAAFDYAIGRKSYIVGSVTRDLSNSAELISQKTRQYLIKKISERWQINALGHDVDRDMWVRLLKQLQEIESENQML